jgi:predicted chitinase
MGISLNVNKVMEQYKESGGKTSFPDSLKKVLEFAKRDPNIKKSDHLAYLLATAKAESDYSLQRWEADYLCGSTGVPYKNKPCQRALDYYRSSAGNKQNYYNLGTDSNGLPYFGRGLIQLTGKDNYRIYGDTINKNLVKNADLALEPKNSYQIASNYMNKKRGNAKKSTFDYVDQGNLTQARVSVNGGLNGLKEVNEAYAFWKGVLKKARVKEKMSATDSSRAMKALGYTMIVMSVLAAGTLAYLAYKKKIKL